MKARLLGMTLVVLLLGGVSVAAIFAALLEPVAEDGEEVTFVVKRGDTLRSVANGLERQGLVRNAEATVWWARLRGQAEGLQAGEYRLTPALPPQEILDRISSGEVASYRVVIPEGLTLREIGVRLGDAGLADPYEFAASAVDPELADSLGIPAPTLEGYLFPETYQLPKGLAADEVAAVMVGQFFEAWNEVAPRASELGLSMHDVVTLASIVEKETGAASERPVISSVFHNRIERGMRLESDPTVIYGIPSFDGNLRRKDLENEANVYNTYRHTGLPPGPIASPGRDSLVAVVEPAETSYLFFVSKGDGTHHFSATYREHARMVDKYQRRRGS